MKYRVIVWIILLLLWCPVAWGQLPVPGILGLSDNSMELESAMMWFDRKGYEKPDFYVEYENESLLVFANKNNKPGFCVVARADVWRFLHRPVLAYSADGTFTYLDNANKRVLLEGFQKQIASLRKSAETRETVMSRHGAVAPLLGGLRWGQHHPYNMHSPHYGDNRIVIGCVPLSMAMVMNYYKWPDCGVSDVFIEPRYSKVFNYKFANFQPQWAEYRDIYTSRDTVEADDLARTLGMLSLSTDPNIKQKSLGKNLFEIKHLFVNNLKYSGRMTVTQIGATPANKVDSILRSELDGGRPCIISTASHAFVCDGYEDDYLHYNLGWNGRGNGYYMLNIGKNGNATEILSSIVYGIEPQRNDIAREVHLAKANTLRRMLSEEEQQSVTSLKLSGPIGSDDVRLLRMMSGAPDKERYPGYPWGALQRLDLSDAKIMKDRKPYYSKRATGSRWRTIVKSVGENSYEEKKVFQFKEMDAKSWREFKNVCGTDFDGYSYSFSDGICWEEYYLLTNTVGINMFADCSSLKVLVLPESVSEIGSLAFSSCQSLHVMRIPKKTKSIGWFPFQYCTSLSKLFIPRGIHYKTPDEVYRNCSPGLRVYDY